MSLVPSIVMGSYDDGPLKALYIVNSSNRSHLSTHYPAQSFVQFILVPLLLSYQNGIALSLRTVLLKNRTISLTCCDSILYVSCPKESAYFLWQDTIVKSNLLFCLLLPGHSFSECSRICLTYLESVPNILSPGSVAPFSEMNSYFISAHFMSDSISQLFLSPVTF